LGEVTTVRVSRTTAEMLERLKEKLRAGNLDEAIQTLMRQRRKTVIDDSFGLDKGRISSFGKGDRGEDRS